MGRLFIEMMMKTMKIDQDGKIIYRDDNEDDEIDQDGKIIYRDDNEDDENDPKNKKFDQDRQQDLDQDGIERLNPSEEEKLSPTQRKGRNNLAMDDPDGDDFNEGEGDYQNDKYQNKPIEKEAKLELSGKYININVNHYFR